MVRTGYVTENVSAKLKWNKSRTSTIIQVQTDSRVIWNDLFFDNRIDFCRLSWSIRDGSVVVHQYRRFWGLKSSDRFPILFGLFHTPPHPHTSFKPLQWAPLINYWEANAEWSISLSHAELCQREPDATWYQCCSWMTVFSLNSVCCVM